MYISIFMWANLMTTEVFWYYLLIGKVKLVFSDRLIAFKILISKVLSFMYILENKSSPHLSKFGRTRSFHQELTETR